MDFTGLIDRIVNETPQPEPAAIPVSHLLNKRKKRNNESGGAFADQLIARVAVDTGAVRIVDGALSVHGIEAVSPIIRQHIEEHMTDVLRIVGELERAGEYGRIYRGEETAA